MIPRKNKWEIGYRKWKLLFPTHFHPRKGKKIEIDILKTICAIQFFRSTSIIIIYASLKGKFIEVLLYNRTNWASHFLPKLSSQVIYISMFHIFSNVEVTSPTF